MLSEEKEAIETVEFLKKKKWYKYAGDDGTEILDEEEKKDVDIVLNLIEKQQNEIEENQVLIDDIKDHRIVYVDTPEFEETFISKDKIKAKIEEYHEKYNNYPNHTPEDFEIRQEYLHKFRVLEELLEEK